MKQPSAPVFVERRTYRRRRMIDAARLLPILWLLLFLMPLLGAGNPADPPATSRGLIFVFVVWAGLIVCAVVLSRLLAEPAGDERRDEPPQ